MTAARDNPGKPQLSFILQFPTAIAALARVKELGAIKYERDNWKKGGKPDWEYLDACLRHIMAFMEGEIFAQDTGCTHLSHALWNIMALQDLNYKGITHDPELFAAMCEYWTLRRAAEKEGETFMSVEEFMERRKGILWETHEFKEGDTVKVFDFDALQMSRTSKAQSTSVSAGPPIDPDDPRVHMGEVPLADEPIDINMEFTYEHTSTPASCCFNTPLTDEAAQELGHIVGESGGYLLGRTDRPIEELQAEAQEDIRQHTSASTKENAELDALINHPSHMRFIKAKQDEAFRKGYAKAQEELRLQYNPYLNTDCGPHDDLGL